MNDTTTDLATIRILPGQLPASLTLVNSSALMGCIELDGDDTGVFYRRRWPSLSTGEELLWRVLHWINGGHDLPHDADLVAGLDALNLAAARVAVTA